MKNRFAVLVLSLCLVVTMLATPAVALAQDHGDEGAAGEDHGGGTSFIGGPDWDDARSMTAWSIVGIGTFSAILGVFYLFKRKVGGFPEHPSWVAPISIMPASELPGDDGDGHAPAHDSHGHAAAH
jgi:hypothetical protein